MRCLGLKGWDRGMGGLVWRGGLWGRGVYWGVWVGVGVGMEGICLGEEYGMYELNGHGGAQRRLCGKFRGELRERGQPARLTKETCRIASPRYAPDTRSYRPSYYTDISQARENDVGRIRLRSKSRLRPDLPIEMSPDAKEPRTLLCQITGKTQDRTQEENKDYSIYTVQKGISSKTKTRCSKH